MPTFLTRLGCNHRNQTDNRCSEPLKLPLPVFLSIFVSQVWLHHHSFTLSKQEPDHLPSCLLPSERDVSAVRQTERERVTVIAASFPGAIIFSLWHPSLPPSFPLSLFYLSVSPPSLLLRSNIIWVQLTSLKSPGCFKRCELEGRQTQGARNEVGETEAKHKKGGREGASGGGIKVNVGSAREERCVWPH